MRSILYGGTAAALSLMSMFVVAQASNAQTQNKEEPPNIKVSEKFATTFFKLAAKKPDRNIVISPYSVSTALSMAYNGAGGKTKSEMQTVLGYSGLSDEAVSQQNSSLYKSLMQVNPTSELTVANAMFANKNFDFVKAFMDSNQKYYGAKIETLDFADLSTVSRINNWVKDNTKSKIPSIVDKVPPDAILYLVNAVYFKGVWLDEFKKDETQPADFKLNNGNKKTVQMMNRSAKMSYFADKNFQAVMLPYKDKRLQMCIFLPDKKSNITAFISNLTAENWGEWKNRFRQVEGHLGLPRFKVEYKNELSEVLKAAGMPCAFEDSCADFKKMIEQNAMISKVLHKTYLEVNERGTEAAAVTAVQMATTCARMDPSPPFDMVCDRPFVVAIRDKNTNAILFVGAIVDPPTAH
ncbi:MAG: serpin family protein [Candidatus Obscuribacterales bacterium]|nr:serpin family protein [Candidatus Obscuribacterales bacterium]